MQKITQTASNPASHPPEPGALQERLIRMPELLTFTSLSRASVYRLIESDSDFPKPVKLGNSAARNSAVGFALSEVQRWIEKRVTTRGV